MNQWKTPEKNERGLYPRQQKMVDAAVALDPNAMNYYVDMNYEEALEFAARCPEHGVSHEALFSLIQAIDEIVPRMQYGPNNPNTGARTHTYRLGRESSRVMYVRILMNTYTPGFDIGALAEKIQAAAYWASPDELTAEYGPPPLAQFRLWWD